MIKNHTRGVNEALTENTYVVSIDGNRVKDKIKIIDLYVELLTK